MDAAIHLRSIVAVAGRYPVLAGADLTVAAGEVVHLSGPNGAGKTSLLRACAGLVAIVDGDASVLGHDLRRLDRRSRAALRRRIGLLGHATFLYDDLTVEENLRFAVRAGGRRLGGAVEREALTELGLDGRLRSLAVHHLSAGQRRRVALAALLARQPELWLLDEPHAGLDVEGRDLIDILVRRAARESGAAVVIASHELDRVMGLATRVLTVVGGAVHAIQPYRPRPEREAPAHVS